MLHVRPARLQDIAQLLPLIAGLSEHHGDNATVTETDLQRDLFGPHPWLYVLVAERGENLLGYAALLPLAQFQFGKRGMDLHHLFTAAPHRGQGIGRALIKAAQDFARDLDCVYFTVGTHADNLRAQAIYPALGFKPASPHGPRFYTLL